MRYAKLKQLMRERGFKQARIATLLGISQRSLTYKLKGDYPFWVNERKALAAILKVKQSEIFPEGQS